MSSSLVPLFLLLPVLLQADNTVVSLVRSGADHHVVAAVSKSHPNLPLAKDFCNDLLALAAHHKSVIVISLSTEHCRDVAHPNNTFIVEVSNGKVLYTGGDGHNYTAYAIREDVKPEETSTAAAVVMVGIPPSDYRVPIWIVVLLSIFLALATGTIVVILICKRNRSPKSPYVVDVESSSQSKKKISKSDKGSKQDWYSKYAKNGSRKSSTTNSGSSSKKTSSKQKPTSASSVSQKSTGSTKKSDFTSAELIDVLSDKPAKIQPSPRPKLVLPPRGCSAELPSKTGSLSNEPIVDDMCTAIDDDLSMVFPVSQRQQVAPKITSPSAQLSTFIEGMLTMLRTDIGSGGECPRSQCCVLRPNAPDSPGAIADVTNDLHDQLYSEVSRQPLDYSKTFSRTTNGVVAAMLSSCVSKEKVEMEQEAVNWIAHALDIPVGFHFEDGGCSGSGGGISLNTADDAVLAAVLAARQRKINEFLANGSNKDVDAASKITQKMVVYCTQNVTARVEMACRIAQMKCRPIGSREYLTGVSLTTPEQDMKKDTDKGLLPCLLIVTNDITSQPSIQDIQAVCALAIANRMWIHVDAAVAGDFWLESSFRCLGAMLDKANSVNVDIVGHSVIWAKELAQVTPWAPKSRCGLLKAWVEIRLTGLNGMRNKARQLVESAIYFEALIRSNRNLRLFSARCYASIVFQYYEPELAEKEIDQLTERLCHFINTSGRLLVSSEKAGTSSLIGISVSSDKTTRQAVEDSCSELNALVDRFRFKRGEATLSLRNGHSPSPVGSPSLVTDKTPASTSRFSSTVSPAKK